MCNDLKISKSDGNLQFKMPAIVHSHFALPDEICMVFPR
jgi:hypothetical protein